MEIRLGHIFAIIRSPIFWTILCILSSSVGEDVSSVPTTTHTNLSQNLSVNNLTEENIEKILVRASDSDVVNSELKSSDVVQSSFEEPPGEEEGTFTKPEYSEIVSQNSGISNELTDDSQGIVVTLVDTASAELKQRAEISSSQKEHETVPTTNTTESAVNVEAVIENITEVENRSEEINEASVIVQQTEKLVLEVPKIEPKENLTEEIPSFSEWAQKQLEEAEKKREEVNSSAQNQNVNGKTANNLKVRSKNYASPDCGAKIVAANPEAVSPSSVLSPSRDEYKLNTCTSRVWFIVELCEAIQAKRIDLANFELFSSSPKDFSVSVSDRFPSREWSNVGHFTAKDERDVQTFDLNPTLFGKYIKVEMHSHHGSEHFCPISLFRVYGTSEFEVLEKEDQQHTNNQDDDDDDETLDSEKGQSPKNLFSSATDAVISMVKKAAEVLGNKRNASNQTIEEYNNSNIKYTPLISTCTTPSHLVVCDNCSDILFGKVYELLSCQSTQLKSLLNSNIIRQTMYNTDVCLKFGLDFQSKKIKELPSVYNAYVTSIFPMHYIAALCNTVAIVENKVVLNISKQFNITNKETTITDTIKETIKIEPLETLIISESLVPTKTGEIENFETIVVSTIDVSMINRGITNDISYISQIKPTKTLTPDQMIELTHYVSQEKSEIEIVTPTQTITDVINETKSEVIQEINNSENITESIMEFEGNNESAENMDLENLISDFNMENNTNVNSATPSPPQKESVFLRLSNRIKTLERNMSLSSQYLEELSRRYKKQVEEMQRLLEKTVATLNEESKKKDERNDHLEKRIKELTEIVEALVREKNNAFNPLNWMLLVALSMIGIFTFCRRNEHRYSNRSGSSYEIQRRKSIDVITHNTPSRKDRRPSEEALNISGTYEHLLVDEGEIRKKNKEKRKKKKKNLLRSNSITTLSGEKVICKPTSDVSIIFRHKSDRQTSLPVNFLNDWEQNNGIQNGIEEIPFVLDESDNNPLQDLPLPKPLQESSLEPRKTNGEIKSVVRKISSPAFLKSTEVRIKKFSPNGFVNNTRKFTTGHKKSASVDETKRQKSPAPSTAGTFSLNLSYDEMKPLVQKKEKKNAFKKIFKKVF